MVNTGNKLSKVPHIAVSIEECEIELGALKILEVIRPRWNQEQILFKLLTDGISNKLVKCNLQDSDEKNSVLIRVYGHKTDLFIDRKAEVQNIVLLKNYALGPELYATFQNGLAYEFLSGCVLTVKTVTCESIYELVAKRLAEFHKVQVSNGGGKPILWKKLENFFDLLPERFSDDYKHERFQLLKLTKSGILKEITYLKELLLKLNSAIVFAHNDLLLANVIYSQVDNSVKFIDYEYAGFNYQAFDIANHFAEFAGVENTDYSYYPSKEFQCKWLRIYLTAFRSRHDITEKDILKLYVEVNHFVLASHIWWGLWALIQAEHSSIEFDFMGYAGIRFNEYFTRKSALVTL